MEQVVRTSRSSELTQGVNPKSAAQLESKTKAATEDFDTFLTGILKPDGENNVSEEALFAALTVERIKALKGEDAANEYQALLSGTEQEMSGRGGYIFYEDAARMALKKFQEMGKLTAEEAEQVHSEAFGAAQLDSNLSALYDDVGGNTDGTRAVQSITEALASAKSMIEKYTAGSEKVVMRAIAQGFNADGSAIANPYEGALSTKLSVVSGAYANVVGDKNDVVPQAVNAPKKGRMDGADGFLWKPVSDTNGRLAVLLPGSISQQVENLVLRDKDGKVIEKGYHWAEGFGAEGGINPRKKFSFKRAGQHYPRNLVVEAQMADGTTRQWKIPKPGRRYD